MEHCQGRRHDSKVIGRPGEPLVCLHVLLEVILPPEWLPTPGQGAGEGLDPGVDPLVPGELLVPCEGLTALGKRTLIGPLA